MIRRYPDPRVARVMADLNLGRIQAIRHLQQRDTLAARARAETGRSRPLVQFAQL